MVAATYAWLLNYSALREADGVLLGASSVDQLDVCLDACSNIVDLPDKVRDAFDGAWDLTRPGAAPASFGRRRERAVAATRHSSPRRRVQVLAVLLLGHA